MTETLTRQFGTPSHESEAVKSQSEKQGEGIEVRFDGKTGTLLLGLGGAERLDQQSQTDTKEQGFTIKDQLHLTVIGFKQGSQLKKAIKENPLLEDQITALALNIEWGVEPTGERYMLTKQYENEEAPRQSIIEMVSCPGGEAFVEQLNTLTGLQLEEQPPHVTLATKGNPQGIGINTAADILAAGQRIA